MMTMGRSSPPPTDAGAAAADDEGARAEAPLANLDEPQSVSDWVDEIGMSKYKDAIMGYAGELHDLAMMTDEDVDELVAELGMVSEAGE